MSRDSKSGYYDSGGIEVLDVIRAKLTKEQYQGYLLGNVIKYSLRMFHKSDNLDGQIRDAEKCVNYSTWLLEELKK